jgi:hypothetical protein
MAKSYFPFTDRQMHCKTIQSQRRLIQKGLKSRDSVALKVHKRTSHLKTRPDSTPAVGTLPSPEGQNRRGLKQ